MSKKDYQLIARAFLTAKHENKSIDELCHDLAEELKNDNPSFNYDIFYKACGLIN